MPLHFTIVRTDGVTATLPVTVAPGITRVLMTGGQLSPSFKWVANNCTVGPLVAFGPDGVEVARHEAPLCASTNTIWVIGGSATPSGSYEGERAHVTFANAERPVRTFIVRPALMTSGLVGALLMTLSACGAPLATSTPMTFLLPSPRAGAAACPTVDSERAFLSELAGKGIVATGVSASVGEALFPRASSVCLIDVGSVSFEAAFLADANAVQAVRVCEIRSGDRYLYMVDGQTVDSALPISWTMAGNVMAWTSSVDLDRSLAAALGGSRPQC